MRLESLISLINAELCSAPTIQSFNNIATKPSKVMRGDLYIALNATLDDINIAIENGAYGIVYDLPLLISDDEVAWLKVPQVKDAEFKLLRFHLMSKKPNAFYANPVTANYIKMLKTTSELFIIEDDLSKVSSKLWNIKENQTIIIKEQADVHTLFPMAKTIEAIDNTVSVYPITPFESDITLEDNLYKRQRLPRAFAPYFSQAVSFLKREKIAFTISNLTYPKYCEIISCDLQLKTKDFGQGSKTLIFLDSAAYLDDFIQSIVDLAPWIHHKLFISENENFLGYNNAIKCGDTLNCIQALQKNQFDYALVIGHDKTLLDHVSKPIQQSLF